MRAAHDRRVGMRRAGLAGGITRRHASGQAKDEEPGGSNRYVYSGTDAKNTHLRHDRPYLAILLD